MSNALEIILFLYFYIYYIILCTQIATLLSNFLQKDFKRCSKVLYWGVNVFVFHLQYNNKPKSWQKSSQNEQKFGKNLEKVLTKGGKVLPTNYFLSSTIYHFSPHSSPIHFFDISDLFLSFLITLIGPKSSQNSQNLPFLAKAGSLQLYKNLV